MILLSFQILLCKEENFIFKPLPRDKIENSNFQMNLQVGDENQTIKDKNA